MTSSSLAVRTTIPGSASARPTHYIRLDFLERVVLYEVSRLAAFASEYEDAFIKAHHGPLRQGGGKCPGAETAGTGRAGVP